MRTSGFTLVELLVALALAALLAVAVQQLALGAFRSAARLQHELAAAQRPVALDVFRADLEQLAAGAAVELGDGRLRVTTLNAMQSGRLAPRHAVDVVYRVHAREDGGFELLRVEREPGERSTGPGIVLAHGLAEVRMEIFDGRAWHTRWPLATPRAARAARLMCTPGSGNANTALVPLAPQHWRRHDEP